MIPVQDVVDKALSRLDAEGSDRYLFDQDFKPAINQTIDWLTAVFNKAFETTKLSAENLRDLNKVRVWQANGFSRIYMDPATLGHDVWSIIGVFPKPTVEPVTAPPALANNTESVLSPTLSYITSKFSAKNLPLEKWNENADNIFEAGNETVTNQYLTYAYLSALDYTSVGGNYDQVNQLEIRPGVPAEYVAIAYVKRPTQITVIGDNLEYPVSLTDMVVDKTLNFISEKQGDGTNLYSVTERDVTRLVQIMI